MKPVTLQITGETNSQVVPLNHYVTPFNLGFGVSVSGSGSCTYTVQHTFDDVWSNSFSPSTATWFNHPSFTAVTSTTSADGNYAFPVTGIRIIGNSGNTYTVTMKLVQAGSAAAN